MSDSDVSRRAAMRTALKSAVYAAPVLLAATVPAGVAAQVSGGGATADAAMTAVIIGSSTVHNGGTITILVTATNNGPAALTDPSCSGGFTIPPAALQAQIVLVSAAISQGTYASPGFVYTGPGASIAPFWIPGPLEPGQSATLTLMVRVTLITTPITVMFGMIIFPAQFGRARSDHHEQCRAGHLHRSAVAVTGYTADLCPAGQTPPCPFQTELLPAGCSRSIARMRVSCQRLMRQDDVVRGVSAWKRSGVWARADSPSPPSARGHGPGGTGRSGATGRRRIAASWRRHSGRASMAV